MWASEEQRSKGGKHQPQVSTSLLPVPGRGLQALASKSPIAGSPLLSCLGRFTELSK